MLGATRHTFFFRLLFHLSLWCGWRAVGIHSLFVFIGGNINGVCFEELVHKLFVDKVSVKYLCLVLKILGAIHGCKFQ